MKFILDMPFWSCPPIPAFVSQQAIMEISVAAEEAGFSGVAFTEHPIPSEAWRQTGGHDALDPMIGLAYASAVTKKLRLLTFLVVLPYRNPFLLAKSAATLDALSGGRLTLGSGAGYLKREFGALGVDFEERNALFDEAIDVLKLAWSGEPVHYQGKHFSAKGVTAQPRPAQRPHPPIWIGGNSKLTLRRIAEKAQGWLAMPSTPEQAESRRSAAMDLTNFEERVKYLKEQAAAAGRREPIDINYPVGYTQDRGSADIASIPRLAALGVTWGTWAAEGKTVAEIKDQIRRFSDDVISKYN